jgi:glutamyl-tRNA synthetase
MSKIRVRFAPSPTGYLHVGGLRTALYNFLFARQNNGSFILRIEDTDRTRYVEGAAENLITTLKMMDINYDEGPDSGGEYGPYYQSQRQDIYQEHIGKLLDNDAAYHCFCTSETLQKMREEQAAKKEDIRYDGRCRKLSREEIERKISAGEKYVIRAKTPVSGELKFEDLIREKVTFHWDMVDDQVLMKSDGFPTYHLANVIDDHLMEITHVIRGEEWLSSVPKHIFLYEAFGWEPPKMAHLPLLLNPDKSKLSKRQGDVAVEDFLAKGYVKEALVNFIALLGWHPSGDRELFTLDELISAFSLERISKAGAVFDIEKLNWMNGQYIRHLDLDYIAEKARPLFMKENLDISDEDKYQKVVAYTRNRITLITEITTEALPFYRDPDIKDEDRHLVEDPQAQELFRLWIEMLKNTQNIDEDKIKSFITQTTEKLGLKGKKLYFPLRVALYGSCHGPDIPTIYAILGKEVMIRRLNKVIEEK